MEPTVKLHKAENDSKKTIFEFTTRQPDKVEYFTDEECDRNITLCDQNIERAEEQKALWVVRKQAIQANQP